MENIYLAKTTERLLLPLLQYDHPWVVDVHMPMESIFHGIAVVYVNERCQLCKEEIAEAVRRCMLLKKSKAVIIMYEHNGDRDF
ncbi:MAG: menaquinone biosynthesis decarboxylase, partial [Gammaproteobacteria bacterium]|nr:menaquinone biosynthesis decarboxylase [Gammaproteobacteria bacterium]NIT41912.1 menaquinone biosynthesis decarboxylase [Gammaproteobacteria bacterium]